MPRRVATLDQLPGAGDPQRPVLACAERTLSYGELERTSRRVAARLLAAGVRPGDRVGICCPKGIEAVVALFGALRCRGAYVPLDPTAPVSRTRALMNDCGIRVLIAGAGQARRIALDDAPTSASASTLERVLVLGDALPPGLEALPAEPLDLAAATPEVELPEVELPEVEPEDLAYVLFTSGSTGRPKGVMMTHAAALAFARWAAGFVGLTAEDRCGNHAPLHFDLSTFDLFATLLAGATTVIVPPAASAFPAALATLLEQQAISVWYSVPFVWLDLLRSGQLEGRDLSALRALIYAGEAFPPRPLRRLMGLLPGCRVYNFFGPTETNVCAAYELPGPPPADAEDDKEEDKEEEIPIGTVCDGLQAEIVDAELRVTGPWVMRGYWGQPELTAQTLARGADGQTYVRTGDLVHRGQDGLLRFIGRRDAMVKIGGYRVELGEVEAAACQVPGVEQACAVALSVEEGWRSLALFYTSTEKVEAQTVIAGLRQRLPPYMLPTRAEPLPALPRLSSGKVDRQQLAALAAEQP